MSELKSPKQMGFVNNVKFWACFSVIAVHFRLNVQGMIESGAFTKWDTLFFSLNYQVFIPCVPLFIITTGYLMLNKTFSKEYVFKVLSVYSLYVICSLLTFSIQSYVNGTSLPFGELLAEIFNFELIGYSWYAEMYLGFCLFIPILNKLIANSTQKEMRSYILAMIIAISIPTLINKVPLTQNIIHLPNYWKVAYPIIYYFMGSYLRKYELPVRLSNPMLGLLLTGTTAVGVAINYLSATPRAGGDEGGYASLLVVLQSLVLFLLIKRLFTNDTRLTRFIAKLTLPIYLMSYTVDKLLYPYLIPKIVSASEIIFYAFWVVLLVFILSVLLAYVADKLNTFLWQIRELCTRYVT